MTKSKLMNSVFQWGVLAAIVAVAMPELALAQTGSGGSGSSIGANLNSLRTTDLVAMPVIISSVCYIGGAVLVRNVCPLPAGESAHRPCRTFLSHLPTGASLTPGKRPRKAALRRNPRSTRHCGAMPTHVAVAGFSLENTSALSLRTFFPTFANRMSRSVFFANFVSLWIVPA
jgi:hypothetical protein